MKNTIKRKLEVKLLNLKFMTLIIIKYFELTTFKFPVSAQVF